MLAALHTMGAEGPFHAVIEDRLTVVHVSRVSQESTAEDAQAKMSKIKKSALKWLSPLPERDEVFLDRLCEAVVMADTTLALPERARAVVVAYCLHNHKPSPLPTTYKAHRKVERLATGIIKEIENELH